MVNGCRFSCTTRPTTFGIGLKMRPPVLVREHDIRRAIRAVLIRAVEEAAKIRLQSQGVEIVSAGFVQPDGSRISADVQPGSRNVESCQIFKAAVAVAQIEIVGIRLVRVAHLRTPEGIQALRPGYIQRPDDQRIHHTEDHGIGANRQGQRQHRGDGEARRLAQHAQAEPHIVHHAVEKIAAQRFVAFLFELLLPAELDARAPLGFRPLQAGALQIISPVLDVRAQLLFHLGVDLGTAKQSGNADAKRIEEFHTSSGCGARAEPMAVASRFQLAVSSCRRFCPAGVSW